MQFYKAAALAPYFLAYCFGIMAHKFSSHRHNFTAVFS